MDTLFNAEERELVKLVTWFKKKAQKISEEKPENAEEYTQLVQTCEKLVDQLGIHAKYREAVLDKREELKMMVKDNARCPECNKADMLKLTGVDTSAQGWKNNKYRCRRCNIEFVWNTPNNPWDMVPYVEEMVAVLEKKINEETPNNGAHQLIVDAISSMKGNLEILRPIVEASDKDYSELQAREQEMADIVQRFKKQLMIEKIRMEM
jgi:hypothetical protein